MKVLLVEGPGRAAVMEVEDPVGDDYEAEVEMVVCGICNSTDRMLRKGTFAPGVAYPSVLGHESVGRITSTGARVRYLRSGQLVTRCSAYGWAEPPMKTSWGGFAEGGVVRDLVSSDFFEAHHRRLRTVFPCNDGFWPCRRASLPPAASGAMTWAEVVTHRLSHRESPEFYTDIFNHKGPSVVGSVIDRPLRRALVASREQEAPCFGRDHKGSHVQPSAL
jgi:threonine dehydrogenase-like Zn-dependent dehydrogenase